MLGFCSKLHVGLISWVFDAASTLTYSSGSPGISANKFSIDSPTRGVSSSNVNKFGLGSYASVAVFRVCEKSN